MANINQGSPNRKVNYSNDTTTTSGFAGLAALINGSLSTSAGSRHSNLEMYEFFRELYNSGIVSGTITTSGGTVTAASFTGS